MNCKPQGVKLDESVYNICDTKIVCAVKQKKVIYVACYNVTFLM